MKVPTNVAVLYNHKSVFTQDNNAVIHILLDQLKDWGVISSPIKILI